MLKIVCALLFVVAFGWAEEVEPSEGEFNSNLFEGDLVISPSLSRAGRNSNRWPGGIFYYHLTSGITSQSRAMSAINAAIQEWEAKTCIRFKRRTNEPAYVEFVTGRGGCWSNGIGRNGNRKQTINLDPGCWGKGTVVHEIGHALGFWHEQSRPDRDEYIEIIKENIKPGMESQFRIINSGNIDHQGSPYDFGSIMHYPKWAFQKAPGLDTIRALPQHGNPTFGQRKGLSVEDAKQMNRMYSKECRSQPATRPTVRPTNGGSCVDKNARCSGWKQYCTDQRFKDYMRRNCPKTCNLCEGPRPTAPECKDNNQNCRHWTKYCNNNNYVINNCKRSCNRCG